MLSTPTRFLSSTPVRSTMKLAALLRYQYVDGGAFNGRSTHTRLRHHRSSRHSRKCGIQPTPVSIQHSCSSGNRSNTPVRIRSVIAPVAIENTWLMPPIALARVGDRAGRHREHVAHAADCLGARGLAAHVVQLIALRGGGFARRA